VLHRLPIGLYGISLLASIIKGFGLNISNLFDRSKPNCDLSYYVVYIRWTMPILISHHKFTNFVSSETNSNIQLSIRLLLEASR